jgi:hypothetical protein
MRTSLLAAVASVAASGVVSLAACHGNSETYMDANEGAADCALHDDVQTYIVGLVANGEKGVINADLMEATPAPPSRNNNTWVVKLVATGSAGSGSAGSGSGSALPAGTLISDATITATPYMPDHGHGTPIEVIPTYEGNGEYQLTPVNLWMPGYWVTTMVITSPTAGDDTLAYKFCILQ